MLDSEMRRRWGDFAVEAFPISGLRTGPIIMLDSPYATYRYIVRERLRKFEPVEDVTFVDVVLIATTPATRDSLSIQKIVVQRDGAIIQPLVNALTPTAFQNAFGATMTKYSGAVAYPLIAFAPGATVVVTAVPEHGENVVMPLMPETLERIR